MLRSMIVGLDGSPFAEAALQLSLAWAGRFDCELAAIGVIDEPTIRRPQGTPVGGGAFKVEAEQARLAEARQKVAGFLADFSERCAQVQVNGRSIEAEGEPYACILREAARFDLVVMGRESHFHFETQDAPGETLEQVLRSTPRPVVAVPETPQAGAGVVVAYDGSMQAARALQVFLATGLHALGPIHVVSIHSKSESLAAAQAAVAVDYLAFHNIAAHAHAIHSSGRPATLLLEQADALAVEMIVMGCYGKGRLHEFFLGSATRDVLKNTRWPLFLYH